MIDIEDYIHNFYSRFRLDRNVLPWDVLNNLEHLIANMIQELGNEYKIENNTAIHKSAIVEKGAILKGSVIISENCFIAAHAYIRGPVFLGEGVTIGPGSEIKHSIISDGSTAAHFNYIGDSIIGAKVNFEAGAVCANHFNDRKDKTISVFYNNQVVNTHCEKFGSLVGDECKIGANAVLSPGSVLNKNRIVKRLELVEQFRK